MRPRSRSRSTRNVRGAGGATGSNDLESKLRYAEAALKLERTELANLVRANEDLESRLYVAENKLRAIRSIVKP